jgi:hypothetical protein
MTEDVESVKRDTLLRANAPPADHMKPKAATLATPGGFVGKAR